MSEIGWYLNNKFYNNKWSCVLDNKYSSKNVTFYFYDDVFNKLNWEEEPSLSFVTISTTDSIASKAELNSLSFSLLVISSLNLLLLHFHY